MNTKNGTRVIRDKIVTLPVFTFLISALFMSFGANATLIDFDEANGALINSNSGSGNDFLIDTVGSNKWKGGGLIEFSGPSLATIDLNRFRFTVADGLEITGVSFQLSNAVITSQSQLQHAIYDRTSVPQDKVWETFYDNSGTAFGLPATPITPVYPFGAGDYSFYAQYWDAQPCCDRVNPSWNWDLEIIISSTSTVPEPSILALMGLGLAGLGFARRRRNLQS